jgi:hypothetical protein
MGACATLRNAHHSRRMRSPRPTGAANTAGESAQPDPPERPARLTGAANTAAGAPNPTHRNGHHARPERPTRPAGVLITADPERSSWPTGAVIMGDRSGHLRGREWSSCGGGASRAPGPASGGLPRRSWVRRARGERLLPLGSSRDCWDIGGAPVAAGGGYGEAETSTRDGHPWGQVLTDGGIAAVIPLLVATRETYSPVKRPACCPSLVRPPGCGSGARRWDGLVAVSARRYATPAAGWPEGCFRPGFSDSEDRCQ